MPINECVTKCNTRCVNFDWFFGSVQELGTILANRVMSLRVPYKAQCFSIGLIFKNFTFCHTIGVFYIYLRTIATFALYNANWLFFITEMKSVYCAVRTGALHKAVCASCLRGLNKRILSSQARLCPTKFKLLILILLIITFGGDYLYCIMRDCCLLDFGHFICLCFWNGWQPWF